MIWHGSHTKLYHQQFFVAAGMCLPRQWPAMIGGYINRAKDSLLIWHGLYGKQCLQQFFYCSIYCPGNVSTEPMPSNCRRIQIQRLMEGIYQVCHWDGLICHGIPTKFQKDWFSHSKVGRGGGIQRQTAWGSHKATFISFNVRKIGYKYTRSINTFFLSKITTWCYTKSVSTFWFHGSS